MARLKRTRRKISFHKICKSYQENARLMMQRYPSFTSMDEDEKSANVSDSCQRFPESMLFEPQGIDLCREKFSPEIVLKHTTARLRSEDVHEKNDTEVESEIIATWKMERPSLSILNDAESNRVLPSTENYDEKNMEFSFEEDSNQQVNIKDNCCLLDKTLTMNDDIAYDMKRYLDSQPPIVTTDYSVTKTTSSITTMTYGLQTKPASALTILNGNGKHESEFANDAQSSYDESEPFVSSISVDGHDRDNLNKKRSEKPNDNKSFNANENISKDLPENWHEFRKIFAYLNRINKKILGEDSLQSGSLFSKHKKFARNDRRFHYTLLSPTSSFASSHTSPKSSRNYRNSENHNVIRTLFANHQPKFKESLLEVRKTPFDNRQGSTTPCSGSSPLTKLCGTILKFENKDGEIQGKSTALNSAEVVEEPILPMEKKAKQCSISLNPLSFDNIRWHSISSLFESIPNSEVDLPVSDYDDHGNSSNEAEYQTDSRKHCKSQSTETLRDSRDNSSERKNISNTIIARVIYFCIWLMKKLLHLLRSSYKKLRQATASFLSSIVVASWFENSQTNDFNHLIVTLRSENEKLLLLISEKMTHLSTDFVQIQTSTETTLNVLIAEMKSLNEISKKTNENNKMLMEELKRLHKTLEEVRQESSQVPTNSACPSSFLPSASPSPPLLSSLSVPPPRTTPTNKHILELQRFQKSLQPPLPPPPPPPLPPPFLSVPPPPPALSVSLYSPMPSIPPTTPNSSKSKKTIITPTRKCSTPLLNRPSITVEDLLKVTLKKAPQNIKDNRRNTVPGPRGPVVSLDMLRNVKLKSARRKTNDQNGRSPRGGRVVKSRVAPSLNVSPIMVGSEGNLERILRQVDLNRRGPRRLLSGSSSFRELHDSREEARTQSLRTLKHSQSAIA